MGNVKEQRVTVVVFVDDLDCFVRVHVGDVVTRLIVDYLVERIIIRIFILIVIILCGGFRANFGYRTKFGIGTVFAVAIKGHLFFRIFCKCKKPTSLFSLSSLSSLTSLLKKSQDVVCQDPAVRALSLLVIFIL